MSNSVDIWKHKHRTNRWTKERWEEVEVTHSHLFSYRTHKHNLEMTGDSALYTERWGEAFDIRAPRSETLALKLRSVNFSPSP